MKAPRPALDSLWLGTVILFWQTDRRRLKRRYIDNWCTQFRKIPGSSGMQAVITVYTSTMTLY